MGAVRTAPPLLGTFVIGQNGTRPLGKHRNDEAPCNRDRETYEERVIGMDRRRKEIRERCEGQGRDDRCS